MHTWSLLYTYRLYTFIYLRMLNVCIRHAWKSLGNLEVLGIFDMFFQQRSMWGFFCSLFSPLFFFTPKSNWDELTCGGIPALSQRGENCLDINVGWKGHVFITVFKQMCNWWIGLTAFCQYSVSHYSWKLTVSSGSWLFSNYPFPASCL